VRGLSSCLSTECASNLRVYMPIAFVWSQWCLIGAASLRAVAAICATLNVSDVGLRGCMRSIDGGESFWL